MANKGISRSTRKSVDLTEALDEKLTKKAKELNISIAELLRRAADRVLKEEEKRSDGYNIGAWKEDKDGKVERAYLYEL